jgi:hypothetical protein
MTVECRETRYGRPVGDPKPVKRGTRDWLYIHPLHGAMIAKAIRIDSDWRATVLDYFGFGVAVTRPLVREEINQERLQTSPLLTFRDTLLWRRRHYSWKED